MVIWYMVYGNTKYHKAILCLISILFSKSLISWAHQGRNVDCPDEVTLWTAGHVTLEYVGFSVDRCYFSAIIIEAHLFHRSVLPVYRNITVNWVKRCYVQY